MRYTILVVILLATHIAVTAQKVTNDSIVIGKQVDAFFTSWNKHNFDDMKNYIAEDCDFVNTSGMHWKGREDIQYAHNKIHEQIFKDKPLKQLSVNIRFLTDNVALAYVQMHLEGDLITPDGSKRAAPSALATFVFLKKNEVWLITSAENVFIDKEAQPFNPITTRNNQKSEKK